MALEASEVAVRVHLVGGSAFQAEANKVATSTAAIGKAGAAANTQHATTIGTLGSAGNKLKGVGDKMIGFGRTLTMMGVPLAAAGAYSMKAASGFNQQMTLLATNANEHMSRISSMSKQAQALGVPFAQMPVDMAKGLYPFESAGIHGTKALNDIKAALSSGLHRARLVPALLISRTDLGVLRLFCPSCGVEHHWLACPVVEQSIFNGEDPEWVEAELEDLAQELQDVEDPELRRMVAERHAQLLAFMA